MRKQWKQQALDAQTMEATSIGCANNESNKHWMRKQWKQQALDAQTMEATSIGCAKNESDKQQKQQIMEMTTYEGDNQWMR